jgi:ubiquinone/menaquinone biosynthesis C-methylase UbiE
MHSSPKPDWDHFGRSNAARQWRKQSAAMGRNVTELIVRAAAAEPGMRILDVACGTGEPAISLARLLDGTGAVVGVDISPAALKVAQERAAGRRLANAQFQLADVHQLPFPDNTFDRITSRLGVMFFVDLPRAAEEMRRVLKPGGRIALLAWGPMQQPYFETMSGTVLRTLPGASLPSSAHGMFAFGIAGALTRILSDAGFKSIKETFATVPWTWPGAPEEVWAYFQEVAAPFAPLLKSIPPHQRAEVDEAVLRAISRYYDGKEIKFTATVNVTSAVK